MAITPSTGMPVASAMMPASFIISSLMTSPVDCVGGPGDSGTEGSVPSTPSPPKLQKIELLKCVLQRFILFFS